VSRFAAVLTATFAAGPAFAADVDLKSVYLQPVQGTVVVDRRGKAWFRAGGEIRDAANTLACEWVKGDLLLADAAGRLWCQEQYGTPKLRYWDGKTWTDTGLVAGAIFEDAAGRVFVQAASALHVFADGKWAKEPLPGDQGWGRGVFAEDAKGRTWYWTHRTGANKSPQGVWAFDGKEWTAHDPPGRAKGEYLDWLVSFADDWFLVLVVSDDPKGRNRHWPRAFAWSPSRTAGEVAKAAPFDGLPLDDLEYRGTDLDGVAYFRWHDREKAPDWQRDNDYPPFLAVSAERAVRKLTREQAVRVAGQPHDWWGTKRIFAKSDAGVLPPVLTFAANRAAGRDQDGRVYLTDASGHLQNQSNWVLWPEKERTSEVLRLTEHPRVQDRPAVYADLFADAAGFAFARPYSETDRVVAWDGKKWADTPIKPLPLAHWTARPAPPPEYGWANYRQIGRVSGTDGRTVFARLKTRHAPEGDGQGPRGGLQSGRPGGPVEEKKDDPFYVYEAWTHKGGAWSEPLPPADLFQAKRKELIAGLAVPSTPSGPVPVVSHGGRLWYAIDWKVSATDADGVTHSADLPKPEPAKPNGDREKPTPPVMLGAFANLDDKTLLLVVSGAGAKAYRLTFRGVRPAGVRVEEVAPPPVSLAVLHQAAGGPVRAWADTREEVRWTPHLPGGRSVAPADPRAVYRLDDGKWVKEADVAVPVAATADGTLWCPPHAPAPTAKPRKGATVLYRLRGGKSERFAWEPGERHLGFERPGADAAVFSLPGVGLVCLEPTKDGLKPPLRVRHTGTVAAGSPVLTAGGHALFPQAWGRLTVPTGN
jgi:hypothetical protein